MIAYNVDTVPSPDAEYHVIMLHYAQWTTNYFARASILIGLQFGHVIEQRSNQNNRSDDMRMNQLKGRNILNKD